MKTAVFGDIHSNFTAWQVAFEKMQSKGVDRFLCTGDLVGYGPEPNKVITDLRKKQQQGLKIKIVLGNHDQGVIDDDSLTRFNTQAKQALSWTKKRLSQENKEFLAELPRIIKQDNILLTHGTPHNPSWEYLQPWKTETIFKQHRFQYCFVGHTHLLQLFKFTDQLSKPTEISITPKNHIQLSPEERIIANVGSIGQPRDHNPDSSFVIWDDQQNQLEYIRCEYDIGTVQNQIYNSQLPDFEADRLTKGR